MGNACTFFHPHPSDCNCRQLCISHSIKYKAILPTLCYLTYSCFHFGAYYATFCRSTTAAISALCNIQLLVSVTGWLLKEHATACGRLTAGWRPYCVNFDYVIQVVSFTVFSRSIDYQDFLLSTFLEHLVKYIQHWKYMRRCPEFCVLPCC